MTFTIDKTTYNKAAKHPLRYGYQMRGTVPSSVVIHSTSNPRVKETAFSAEANFLLHSATVSAHFLVGKSGQIVQFLDPRKYQAWHAGQAKAEWVNARSIGIELHHSVDDPPYPTAQKAALTWLVRLLMEEFRIDTPLIDTHRAVALPPGRKADPHNWGDAAFYVWRAKLVPMARLWTVTAEDGVNVRAEADPASPKIAPALPKGTMFHGELVGGVPVAGVSQWVARLLSEGGGFLWGGAVAEVV